MNEATDESAQNLNNQEIPAEIKGWNWGAFFLNWIWGIGNRSYIALLALIPLFGWIWMIVLGMRGNEWAWKNNSWDSVAAFKANQRKWAIWGGIIWLAAIAFAIGLFCLVMSTFKNSEPYKVSVHHAKRNVTLQRLLGTPIEPGWFTSGNITYHGNGSANAELSIPLHGSKDRGVLYVKAYKRGNRWFYNEAEVYIPKQNLELKLLKKRKSTQTNP